MNARFFLKFFVQDRQRFHSEAGANFAGESEFLVLIVTNEDRAEIFARPLRRRVSADNKFLFVDTFELDPCAASAPGFVNGVTLFADNSFQAATLYFFEKSFGVAANRAGVANRITCVSAEFFQNVFARLQGQ